MERGGATYILTNIHHTVLYVGVTSDLLKRMYEHKNKLYPGFSAKYNTDKLVHYELFYTIEEAIAREKQIKKGPRSNKIKLIDSNNPEWKDLYDEVQQW
ncbi:MAG: GIY-YIG nuclease family protein [Bacteroidia bacterium]|nr:GIY-YIG nuclease family protein [Bacteroidia bacterium]MBP7260251.1 GIY-YIG nuclease family protein [Bacteroidia bacterium]MBP9180535.1 GIY-YIG nuclease family protein [Bacteroidia bacterium]MBP9724497.1 GIY-YIG nuclease family protein [Bacteroidia bacterium]